MDVLNLTKSEPRGAQNVIVDKTNSILCLQWRDSKVVNVITSQLSTEIGKGFRQIGRNKLEPMVEVFQGRHTSRSGTKNLFGYFGLHVIECTGGLE